jgi:hypothetical protein
MHRLAPLFLALALLLPFNSPSLAAKRVAFVVGNNTYANVPALAKAENDADSISTKLKEVGFQVQLHKNLDRRGFNMHLQGFLSKLGAGDEALFFFAGHGVEIRGQNYLLPIDIPNAEPGQESFVKSEAIGVDYILSEIGRRKVRLSLLILDACRNNPFQKAGTRSLGRTRGLGTMEAPPEGTFILYSAGFGQAALDRLNDSDPHPNSVFTRTLIPLLSKPGLKLSDTARQVRRKVMKLASTVSHEQRPAYYDEVLGDFYFTPPGVGVSEVAQPKDMAKTPARNIHGGGTCGVWPQIATSATYAQVEAFLAECKSGIYSTLAKARLAELKQKQPDQKLALLPPKLEKPKKPSKNAQKLFTRAWNIFNGKNGETKDHYKAVRLYKQAVAMGHKSAMVNLGYSLENGFGIEKNVVKAAEMYKKAAELGEAQGMTNLGYMYENGKGIKRDLAQAANWYRKSALAGNFNGMTNFGYMNEMGRGVKKNYKEAVKWYRRGADGGVARAKNNLAYMYLYGRGIKKSPKTAWSLYNAAAKQGFANSYYMMGYMKILGKGVKRNDKEAAKWVFKALEGRHQFAVREMTTNSAGWSKPFRRELQRLMKNAGYYNGPLDGNFGSGTYNAIRAVAGQ